MTDDNEKIAPTRKKGEEKIANFSAIRFLVLAFHFFLLLADISGRENPLVASFDVHLKCSEDAFTL